jgi:CheY-like chemotaxis protein
LFTELLDLSRLDAGYVQVRAAHVPLEHVFDRLRGRYAPLAESKHIALTLDASGAVVYTDPVLLERLLGNLVANAIQYTEAGVVRVCAAAHERDVSVGVRDTGIGIPQQFQERVFDEFFQIGNPERDRRKGLGLGLAIVRRISQILGHPVLLESESGAGSCFRLNLPPGDPAAIVVEADVPPSVGNVLSGKTVLVVDDEVSVLDGMQELLARWAARSCARDTRRKRLPRRTRERPTSSSPMSVCNAGQAAWTQSIASNRRIPAVVITGDTAVEVMKEAGARGLPLLHKPVRPMKLRSTLTQLLKSADR